MFTMSTNLLNHPRKIPNLFQLQYSDKHQLHLRSVGLETAGLYRCEVSTEAPDFDTLSESVRVRSLFAGNVWHFLMVSYFGLFVYFFAIHVLHYLKKEMVSGKVSLNGLVSLFLALSLTASQSLLSLFFFSISLVIFNRIYIIYRS